MLIYGDEKVVSNPQVDTRTVLGSLVLREHRVVNAPEQRVVVVNPIRIGVGGDRYCSCRMN